jgi:hypothetical protein
MSTPLEHLSGVLADRYRIERQLGEGGMATVYLAHDLRHDRDVALKVLRPELAAILGRERFLNEIRLTARLDHPHIVTLIDSGESEGVLWYVLPFIRGESLRARLGREKQLGLEEALAIARQIASALDYAHRQGVIHRDLKPENVLLHEGEAMLADFGIALAIKEAGGSRLTETGLSLGTPSYMSPEQATGDRVLDARSDVYSLGAVLYEMLAGEPPHSGATVQAVIAKLMTERPTRLRTIRDTVPEGVDGAVARALAKVPADRFASAGEFAASLRTEAPGEARRRGSRGAIWAGAAAGLLAIAAGVGFLVWQRQPPRAPPTPVKMTSAGDITAAGLSPDGTRLATSVVECEGNGRCTFALVWRELGGGGELRIAQRLGSLRLIEWSADGRQVLYHGTDSAGRFGAFRVSALGGPARFLGCCYAQFLQGADTVLMAERDIGRGVVLRVVSAADGGVRDSTLLGPDAWISPSPDGRLIAVYMSTPDSQRLVVLDRAWKPLDSVPLPKTVKGVFRWDPTGDAVLMAALDGEGSAVANLLRFPVSGRGRLGAHAPVPGIAISDLGGFSIVGPSRTLVYTAGGEEWSVQALTRDQPSVLTFQSRLIRRSTGFLVAQISPDGEFIALESRSSGSSRTRAAIVPFEGGTEVTILLPDGELLHADWGWTSSSFSYLVRGPGGRSLHRYDLASGRSRQVGLMTERGTPTALGPGVLGWVNDSAYAVVLADSNGKVMRRFPDPDRSERYGLVIGSPDGRKLFTIRWSAGLDSLLFTLIDPESGARRRLGGLRVEEPSGFFWAADGSIQIGVLETWGTQAFYRLDPASGRTTRLAAFPAGGLSFYSFSRDGRRAVRSESRPRGDVWMIRNFDGRAAPDQDTDR